MVDGRMTVIDPSSSSKVNDLSDIRTRDLMGLVLAPVLAVALGVAVGALPTRAVAGEPGLIAMIVAGGMSALAAVLGSLPAVWSALRMPEKLPAMALGATLLRLVALVAMAVPVAMLAALPRKPLLLWLAISYVLALAAESVALAMLIKRLEARK